jgi:VWFA-related protein
LKRSIRIGYAVLVFSPVFALAQQAAPQSAPRPIPASAAPAAQSGAPAPQAPALNPRPAYTPTPAPQEGRIHLDVVVTDKSGKPVSGLELKDFALKDNNLPAKIVSFSAIEAPPQSPAPPTEVTMLIDAVNLGFQEVARTRDGIAAFLRRNGGHLAQPVSVLVLTDGGLKVLLQPSIDGNALADQLVNSSSGLRSLARSAGVNGAIERYDLCLKWVDALARNEIPRPGRKLLIWAGPGWPQLDMPGMQITDKSQRGMFSEIVELSTSLREADMTLYSVSLGMPGLGTYLYQDFVKGVKTAEKAKPTNLSLKVIATQTGGLVLPPDNDLASQIATCVQDATSFYRLSFDPPPTEKENEYHDLKVEIDKPALTARTRRGYYNQP